ncbi:MAG: hypothetical protein K1X57_13615 [Gemmataceae bacterium]|nr:hypothetical protein [Gemmataceae bacterium]
MVSIYDDPGVKAALRFTFVPKGTNDNLQPGQVPQPPPQYIVTVAGHDDGTTFTWVAEPAKASVRKKLEEIAKKRVSARHGWLAQLSELVRKVKGWADSLGWNTRLTEKKMEDHEVGNYKAPALLLQDDAVRLFLEPISRAAPGAEGVVDLYRMPAYDDIASLYYYANRWNVHYMATGARAVGNIRETEAKPLTEATLKKLLEEMKKDAG